jgi:hypothetical protein
MTIGPQTKMAGFGPAIVLAFAPEDQLRNERLSRRRSCAGW